MPYTNNPSGSLRDAVRLMVGDTSTAASGEFLANTDYDYFLAQSGGNTYAAASLAATALSMAASGGGIIEKSVGDLTLKYDFAAYDRMAAKFQRMAGITVSPYAGGISKDDKRAAVGDRDRTLPAFRRNLFDNREAVNSGITLEPTT